jgi:hypothetical protein
VDRPEGGVDVLRIARSLVERLELLLQGAEQFVALLEEGLLEFSERVHGRPQLW